MLPKYSTMPWSAGMAVDAIAFPVAGLAQTSSCVPPIHTAPPLSEGTESRPAPAPWETRKDLVRSPPGANQTHSLIPVPVVPHTPPEVARRFPAPLGDICDDAARMPVPRS